MATPSTEAAAAAAAAGSEANEKLPVLAVFENGDIVAVAHLSLVPYPPPPPAGDDGGVEEGGSEEEEAKECVVREEGEDDSSLWGGMRQKRHGSDDDVSSPARIMEKEVDGIDEKENYKLQVRVRPHRLRLTVLSYVSETWISTQQYAMQWLSRMKMENRLAELPEEQREYARELEYDGHYMQSSANIISAHRSLHGFIPCGSERGPEDKKGPTALNIDTTIIEAKTEKKSSGEERQVYSIAMVDRIGRIWFGDWTNVKGFKA